MNNLANCSGKKPLSEGSDHQNPLLIDDLDVQSLKSSGFIGLDTQGAIYGFYDELANKFYTCESL